MTIRVCAAIDFGTYGTGYSWAFVDERNADRSLRDVEMCYSWPAAPPGKYPKNLTALLIGEDGQVEAWGWDAAERNRNEDRVRGLRYFSGFKMSLGPGRRSQSGLVVDDKLSDPDSLITAMLAEARQAAVESITAAKYLESEIRWCVTVPAIWTEYDQQVMRGAAEAAGFPADRERLIIGIEPEVAALYCHVRGVRVAGAGVDDAEARPGTMGPGTRFVVVDCGGGTIDIVSYRVTDAGKLAQLTTPVGGAHGAQYTSEEFIDRIMRERLGSYTAIETLRRQAPQAVFDFVTGWETARDGFDPDRPRPVNIPIPVGVYKLLDDTALGHLRKKQNGADDAFILSAKEASSLFDSAIDPVLSLIDDQLAQIAAPGMPDKPLVYLVGGFARSKYLQKRIARYLADRAVVLVPQSPEAAVLIGAAHFCYNPSDIWSRRAKFTYGCGVRLPYDEVLDAGRPRVADEDGIDHCEDRFAIFISAGDEAAVGESAPPRTFTPSTSRQNSIVFKFYACRDKQPRYTDEPGVQCIGSVEVKLKGSMHLPRKQRTVEVRMKFGETQTEVTAVNVHTGTIQQTALKFNSTYLRM